MPLAKATLLIAGKDYVNISQHGPRRKGVVGRDGGGRTASPNRPALTRPKVRSSVQRHLQDNLNTVVL